MRKIIKAYEKVRFVDFRKKNFWMKTCSADDW